MRLRQLPERHSLLTHVRLAVVHVLEVEAKAECEKRTRARKCAEKTHRILNVAAHTDSK